MRFFSAKTMRFLRSICCEEVHYMEEVDACFQPCKMWVLNSERILYYGPDDQQPPPICDLEEHKSGLMDPAFWMLYEGDATSAARYVKDHLHLDVNQSNLYSFDNLLFSVLKMSRPKPMAIVQLLAEGVNVDSRDEANRTPLMVACALLLVDCVRVLLTQGRADPRAVCDRGQNAAFYVGRCHTYMLDEEEERACAILRLLHEAGTYIHQRDTLGSLPLFQRALLLNLECVFLISSFPGFNPHAIDTANGYTALHYLLTYSGQATYGQVQRILYFLVKGHGLRADLPSICGQTPLAIAASAPNPTHVHLLLQWLPAGDAAAASLPLMTTRSSITPPSDLHCEEHFRDILHLLREEGQRHELAFSAQ
jgi:hypothetical protein